MPRLTTKLGLASDGQEQIIQAAGLVAALVLLSRLVGLIREIIIRSFLGVTTVEATAYDIANRFPEAIFLIIAGGAIGSAFIPTITAYFLQEDEKGAWRLFSTVINLLTIVVTILAGLTILFAELFVRFFFADNIVALPELVPMTVRLMRLMLISPIIFGVSGVIMGTLNARRHFFLPALAPTIYNLGIIAGGLLSHFSGRLDVAMGLAIGTVVGAMGHLLIQLPGLWQKGVQYSAVLTIKDPGVQQVMKLMAPRIVGLSFSEINKFIILFLTGSMSLGSLPALNTAFRLIIMPQGVLGQALGIAAFPTLAGLAAQSALDEMRRILTDSLRLLIFLGLPTTALLIMLRRPIVIILFQRGVFGTRDVALVTWALLFLALGLVALTALEVIARAFYALSDTFTPVIAGGIQVLLMGVLSLWLSRLFLQINWLPLGGLALGLSISNYIEVGLLLWLLSHKIGGFDKHALLNGLWRMMAATILMAGVIKVILSVTALKSVWLQLSLGALAGLLTYFGLCLALNVREVKQLLSYGRQRWPW